MKRRMLSLLVGGFVAFAMGNVVAQDAAFGDAKSAAKPVGKPVMITAEQRVMLNEKLGLVDRLMRNAGANQVGGEVTAERQRWLLETLYAMPVAKLRTIAAVPSADLLAIEVTKAAKANTKLEGPAFGALNTELVYIPLTPCRFIDTRNVGGPLAGTRAFDLDLTGSSYGGSAACDPSAAVGNNANNIGAVAINVAIVGPTAAPGFVGARPAGATTTTALVNWYQAGASVQASNAGVVTTDQTSALNDEIEFFGSPTQFIVDFFGIFASPTATALDCQDVVVTNTIPANGTLFQGTPACPTGYTRTSGGQCQHGGNYNQVVLSKTGNLISSQTTGSGANAAACAYYNLTATSFTAYVGVTCCRIPGR